MPELISIPLSFFEATFPYKEPNVRLWLDRATVVQDLFTALKPWHIDVDNVEIITTGKPSEQGLKFKLPEKQIAFFFSPTLCRFSKDNADWESAEETIAIMDVAFSTLARSGKIEAAKIETVIALHMQPKALPFMKILGQFVPAQLAALDGEVKTMASIVKWDKRKVIIDGSAQIANALFLRFEREFDGTAAYQQIAEQLRADEEALFAMLDVKEDRP
ncbi:MAG: hypothetical protein ABSG07_14280 [Terriglobales bacterium]|jgi:hypothetical protein